jgi:hypothetical protein
VARPRDPQIAARNAEIYARFYAGESIAELAERYDRKPVVIGRIIARRHPDLKAEADRAMLRGRLEWAMSEMRGVIVAPGFKLGPNGSLAHDDNDEPIPDLMTKVEATKVFLAILDRTAKTDGSDRQPDKKPETPPDLALQQMWAAIAAEKAKLDAGRQLDAAERRELEEYRRRQAQAVPGEVVREIEPPQPHQV